jgi:hypothetical protein
MSGRSRGRAKTATKQEPTTQAPASSATPVAVPAPPARMASPQRTIVPESGRGRGITSTETTLASSTTTPTQAAAAAGATATGEHSPTNGGSSEESPPQQHSPPGSGVSQSIGRAALRGGPHQPGAGIRADIITPMERLALQETGDVTARPARREIRIESVLHTRPESCQVKQGFCSFFFFFFFFFFFCFF